MANISTTDPSYDGVVLNKLLQPGNNIVRILDVVLKQNPYNLQDKDNLESIEVTLKVEGPPLGDGFDGFLIDLNDPSKGKYKGQTGDIRVVPSPFSNGTTPKGYKKDRQKDMMRFIKSICKEMQMMDWFNAQNNKHADEVAFYTQFIQDKPYVNKWVKMCIAGKEYTSKKNYVNYNLFLPYSTFTHTVIELETVTEDKSRILKFNPDKHLVKKDDTTKPVSSFGTAKQLPVKRIGNEFNL